MDKSVVGRLIEKVGTKFDCGVIKVGVINKFLIVEDSKDTKDTIKVICVCPEGFGRDFFKAGHLYTLEISSDMDAVKDCYIMDKYPSQKLDVWVLKGIKNYRKQR